MKKLLISLILLLFSIFTHIFAVDIPDQLYGIWEGKDRYVFFDKNLDTNQQQIVICLKEFYGWYLDRTVEPAEYSEKNKRSRNSATPRNSEKVYLDFNVIDRNLFLIKDDSDSLQNTVVSFINASEYESVHDIPDAVKNAFEIKLKYSNYQQNYIPIAIIDDKIYLNFYIRSEENENLYRGNIFSRGILASEQVIPENTGCLYLDKEKSVFYDVRYWLTDMDYMPESFVNFSRGNISFDVYRHLKSSDKIYTCVNGKGKKVRNPQKPFLYNEDTFLFSQDGSILVKDTQPYLVKIADKNTLDDLFDIIREQNSKRKPDPPPIFPPDDLNWHWDLIDALEANNEIIQQVRKRQLEFGPRGH